MAEGTPVTVLVSRYKPEEVLAELQLQPVPQSTYESKSILLALQLQRDVVRFLSNPPDTTTMEELDLLLLKFLKSIYLTVSALPGALRYSALENEVASSGMAQPFIAGMTAEGHMVIGTPSTDNVTCDSLSEIVRVAAAAVICHQHYLNQPQASGMLAADDSALLFTTLAIKSCTSKDIAQKLESEFTIKPVADILSLAELRWLMHYTRAELCHSFAAVQHVIGDSKKMKDSLVAQQAEYLAMLKTVPANPLGYVKYARSCLQFQQTQAGQLFAAKGILVAEKEDACYCLAALQSIRAVALALGGGGSTFSASDMVQAHQAALRALEKSKGSLPSVYHDLVHADPDLAILVDKVVPLIHCETDSLPALEALYAFKPPSALPPGALSTA